MNEAPELDELELPPMFGQGCLVPPGVVFGVRSPPASRWRARDVLSASVDDRRSPTALCPTCDLRPRDRTSQSPSRSAPSSIQDRHWRNSGQDRSSDALVASAQHAPRGWLDRACGRSPRSEVREGARLPAASTAPAAPSAINAHRAAQAAPSTLRARARLRPPAAMCTTLVGGPPTADLKPRSACGSFQPQQGRARNTSEVRIPSPAKSARASPMARRPEFSAYARARRGPSPIQVNIMRAGPANVTTPVRSAGRPASSRRGAARPTRRSEPARRRARRRTAGGPSNDGRRRSRSAH